MRVLTSKVQIYISQFKTIITPLSLITEAMYQKETEFLPIIEIHKRQTRKLKHLLDYVKQKSPFYRSLFYQNSTNVSSISTLKHLQELPTTSKEDLQHCNRDFLCVPPSEILEYTSTSGTIGTPVTIALTTEDIQRLAYNEYLSFTCAKSTPEDIFQLVLTLDKQFMAGIAYYLGISMLGAGVVRTGPGAPSMQWETIFRLNTTSLVIVPSFIIKLIDYALEHGIDLNASPVKKAICIGENIRNEYFQPNSISKKIFENWNIELYSTYASTEMQTSFTECPARQGGHLHPELLIAEVLDDQGGWVPPGESGELTITTLGIKGMPLVRYRTGDICRLHEEPCTCGRNTPRISPILGRKNQMIKYKGTTLYPPVILDILNARHDVKDYLVEIYSNEFETDEILIHIAIDDPSEKTFMSIRSYLHASLRVQPAIKVTPIEEIIEKQIVGNGRKISKIYDRRKR